METTWEIVAQDGQFLVVEYTRGGVKIRLQILPPTPGTIINEDGTTRQETMEEALATTVRAHEPSAEQFGDYSHSDLSDLIGVGGSTATPEVKPS